MDQTIYLRRKHTNQASLLDTQPISSLMFCESPKSLTRQKVPLIDLNKVKRFSPRSRQSLKSIDDLSFSFNHTEFSTPRVIKASHSIEVLPTSRFQSASNNKKSNVKILNNRIISLNMLLDPFPSD